MTKKLKLSRRTVLRGVLGGSAVAVGLPALDIMYNDTRTAHADGSEIPTRFGIFFWGNGIIQPKWVPPTEGLGWTPSEQLQPLADVGVKDQVSVCTNMKVQFENVRGHHVGEVAILSGHRLVEQDHAPGSYASTFSQPSIDQVLGDVIGTTTRFHSLHYGVSGSVPTGEGSTLNYISHRGPDRFNAPDYNATSFFNYVFGDDFREPGATLEPDPTLMLRRSVLDAVLEDANRLRNRVGVEDRARIEEHMTNIRALEHQIALAEMMPPPLHANCMVPTDPGAPGDGPMQLEARNVAMAKVIAMALACDQTRVFTNMFSAAVSGTVYDVGNSSGHHGLTHDEPGDQPAVNRITKFIMRQYGLLLKELQNIEEGDGNLLDHCLVFASSDLSSGKAHDLIEYPILLGGGCSGRLKRDFHYRAPRDENASKVLYEICHLMGHEVSEFGGHEGHVTSGISAIRA